MLTQCRFMLVVLAASAVLSTAYTARATSVDLIATPFTGADTSVRIVLDDAGGDISVTLTVNEGLADLRGVFFQVANNTLPAGLSIVGDDVTKWKSDIDDLINMRHGNNLRGGGTPCPCDIAVSLGTPGIGKDDIFSTSFVISADNPLTLDLFADQLIGVRVTSVGDDKGKRSGSAKLVGTIPDPNTPVPEPTPGLLTAAGLGALSYYASRRQRRR